MRDGNRFLGKLRLIILILVTVPVLVVGMFSYYRSSGEIKKRVVESNVNVMLHTQINIEQTLRIVDSMVVPFLISSVFADAMEQELASFDVAAYDRMFEGLHALQKYQLPVQNVSVINLEKKWAIDNRGAFGFDGARSDDQIDHYIKAPRSYFWTYEEKRSGRAQGADGYDAIDGISLVAKVPVNSLTPRRMLIVQIPRESLFQSASVNDLTILDENNRTLFSKNEQMVGKDVSFLSYVGEVGRTGVSSGYFETSNEGELEGISYVRSEYNGWTYISRVPIDEIDKDSRAVGLYTLSVSFSILLAAWLLLHRMTGKIFNPIRKLMEAVRSKDSDGTGIYKDELQWIYDRVDSMSRMNVQLSGQLNHQIRYVREYYTLRLLKGQIAGHEHVELDKLFPRSKQWQWMSVFGVEVDTFADHVYKMNDKDLIVFSILNVVNDVVPGDNQLCSVVLDDNVLVVVGGFQESKSVFRSFKLSLGGQIQSALKEVLKIRVNVGISDTYKSWQDTHKAYMESQEALKYRIRYDEEALICIEDVRSEQSHAFSISTQLENELVHAIKFESMEQAEQTLKQLVTEIRKAELPYLEYEFYIFRLVVTLMNLVPDPAVVFPALFQAQSSLLGRISQLKSFEETEGWLRKSVVGPLVRQFEASRGTHQKRLALKMLHMIETRDDQERTIEQFASQLSYSPNYLRRIFLEEVGVNFGEYVSRHRLDKAKRLLLETDLKVAEIAVSLSYSNSQNFIRQFRRWEGVTPGEYRDLHIRTVGEQGHDKSP